MPPLPRIAMGTVQPKADCSPILWALVEAFREHGLQVQGFLSRACFASYHGTASVTGRHPRHLDSWLMSPDLCREVFFHGTRNSDLAVVQGEFASALPAQTNTPASLDQLCHWLDLPRIVVLDVRCADNPALSQPQQADALLLDRLDEDRDPARLAADLEACWGAPVLGGLPELPELRAEIAALHPGARPPRDLAQRLGSHLMRRADPQRIVQLGSRREFASVRPRLFRPHPDRSPLAVALAYDSVFNCYFPDVLDLLEFRGATMTDFSPLRDERLPLGTDLVYLGCGHPERHAAELSRNHCMKLALRNHLRGGGRIYAEGGGLAYLCQHILIPNEQTWRMVGVFPAVAHLADGHQPPTPVEATLRRDTWLCPAGTRLRGYRNPCWELHPAGALDGCLLEPEHQYDLVASSHAIGSQLHLNLAAQSHLLSNFFHPHLPQPDPYDPWTSAGL
jgi:cobyrinic acid a,c-diamide synthase